MDQFIKIGLPVCEQRVIARGVSQLQAFFQSILDRRENLPFDIDGVVYKVNSIDDQQKIGFVSRAPKLEEQVLLLQLQDWSLF